MTENENATVSGPAVSPSHPETSWVQKTDNVCGGDACIRNTRIRV